MHVLNMCAIFNIEAMSRSPDGLLMWATVSIRVLRAMTGGHRVHVGRFDTLLLMYSLKGTNDRSLDILTVAHVS